LILTGFVNAEGCFTLGITRNKECKTRWSVQLFFQIALHQKDKYLLDQIKNYFGVGKIYKHGSQSLLFRVLSIKDLQVIIDHFDKYPLITQKFADYNLFKQAFNLILNKEHLTMEGLKRLAAIKGSLNLGLSPELKSAFPDIINTEKPLVTKHTQKIPDPILRVAGFTTGEGCFYVVVQKRPAFKTEFSVKLKFSIAQHYRDELLLSSLIDYFDCGNPYKNRETFELVFAKFADIENKIIPFFAKYPVAGAKLLDFQDFCKVALIMKEKGHLTIEGVNQIRSISKESS